MTNSIEEKCLGLSTVEAECNFVQIGLEVLRTDLVPRSHDAAFQEREGRLHRVRVHVAANIHAILVLDGFMPAAVDTGFDHCFRVGCVFVGHDHIYVTAHVCLDEVSQRATLYVLSMEETQIATVLPNANYDFLVGVESVMAGSLSTNVSLVYFDSTVHHGPIYFFHGSTYPMAKIPSGFVRPFMLAPKGTLELECAHSFFGFAQDQGRKEPCRERQMGIVKYRVAKNAKLVFAFDALKFLLGTDVGDGLAFATRALDTVRPA